MNNNNWIGLDFIKNNNIIVVFNQLTRGQEKAWKEIKHYKGKLSQRLIASWKN